MSQRNNEPAQVSARRGVLFGLFITALGGLIFSLDLPLLKLSEADRWTTVFCRGWMLFLSISAIWLVTRSSTGKKAPYIAGTAGLAVVATSTIANITYIGAAVETHPANVVFIIALIPILTAVFSRIFLGEKVHGYTWAASFFALVGVGIIVGDGLHTDQFQGDLMAFVSACATAATFTIIRYSGKNVANSLAVGSLVAAVIAMLFFPIDFAALLNPAGLGVLSFYWLALNGLIAIPLASILMSNGPRFLPSVDVSMFFLLETVLTPIWIWLIFGHLPTSAVLWGGTIVVLTLVAHSYWRMKTSYQTDDQPNGGLTSG